MTRRILWDVDTQVDFIRGKLATPGAEQALPAMRRLVAAARAAGIPHVATVDDHEFADAEISAEPDFLTTFPPHCLRGTPGAEKVAETRQHDPVPLATSSEAPAELLRGREFVVLKKHFDVFTNPEADRLLAMLDPEQVVVFGVATDVCVAGAVRGLLARGRRVVFVEEASRGADPGRVAACLAEWGEAGVELLSLDEALALLR